MEKCYKCDYVGEKINEDIFFSNEAQNNMKPLGVAWVDDAFNSEIYGDHTKHWECTLCWWQGWWDI